MAGRMTAGRLFSDLYTAGGQKTWSAKEDFEYELVSKLRLDTLLFDAIVIPDTHLLDGRFFMAVHPLSLAKRLGRPGAPLPLEIRGREETLRDTLRNLFFRIDDRSKINIWALNCIEDPEAARALHGLNDLPSDELRARTEGATDVAGAVAGFLRDGLHRAGFDPGSIDGLEMGWTYWLEAGEETVTFARWDGEFTLADALGEMDYVLRRLETPLGRNLYHDIKVGLRESTKYWSKVKPAIEAASNLATSEAEVKDARLITAWYSHGRHTAIARQHRCDAHATLAEHENFLAARPPVEDPYLAAVLPSDIGENENLQLPMQFLDQLGAIDDEEFAHLVAATKVQREWWLSSRSKDALRTLVEAILPVADRAKPPPQKQRPLVVEAFVKTTEDTASSAEGLPERLGLRYIASLVSVAAERWDNSRRVRTLVKFLAKRLRPFS